MHFRCSSDCITIESGFSCSTTLNAKSVCSEICGDGKKMGLIPCDDGNTLANDGCSSSCQVDVGYTCSGGTKTSPDTCT
jgi:cysteine-rich repeat protein